MTLTRSVAAAWFVFARWAVGVAPWKPTDDYAPGTSHTYPPAWRLMWPVVTFRIRYPTGIVPVEGSAVTAAGLI